MKISCITPRLGIEVWPASLESVDSEQVWALLAKYGVIVLRGIKDVSRENFVAFGKQLGNLEKSPQPTLGFPELTSFTHNVTHPPTENIWHSDMSFLTSPPIGRILRPTVLPDVGGDTLFADMRWVLDNLPHNLIEAIKGLEAEHDIAKQVSPSLRDELHTQFPPTSHSLVKIHPASGERYLFCNKAYTTRVLGVPLDESETLLHLLFTRILTPEAQCRVRWDLETILLWDNRHTQHYAVGDYLPATRSMERLTIVG